MRVGVVAEQLRQRVPGGIGTYAAGLLKGLRDLADPEVDVTIIASKGPSPDPLCEFSFEVAATRWTHRIQMQAWDRGLVGVGARGLDVLHLTSLAGPMAHGGSASGSIMVHDLSWRRYPELTTARGVRWHESALRRALASGNRLIVPSAVIHDDLCAAGADPMLVTVIGEGADHMAPPDRTAAEAVLAAHGHTGAFWLTVSTLEPRKNLERLIEAHGLSNTQGSPPWPLVVVGPTGWGPSLRPRAGVHFVGPQSGSVLAGLYERCSGFAYVPIHEGFGLPPLEAMALGAPVVSSDAVPSMIDAPVAARCDATNVTSITAALTALMGDEARRAEHRSLGRVFGETHRWRDTAASHVDLWRGLR